MFCRNQAAKLFRALFIFGQLYINVLVFIYFAITLYKNYYYVREFHWLTLIWCEFDINCMPSC